MQIAESTRDSLSGPENNSVGGVSADETIFPAELRDVDLEPTRGCATPIRPPRHIPKQRSLAITRSGKVPITGADGDEIVGEIAKTFIHDINNVLSVIGGGLRLLERERDSDARGVIFDRINRSIDRGARLSRSLLNAGRRCCPATGGLTSQGQLAVIVETLGQALGERSRLEIDISSDLWQFAAEPEELYFALLNLCRNADGAMPRGGVVSISAANIHPVPATSEGAVAITVTDTGSGMSKDVLSRAFEPYYTTKAAGHGTGLGLPQVRKFVEQHGGAIQLESMLAVGTTVRMIFPRTCALTQAADTVIGVGDTCPEAGARQSTIGYIPTLTGGTFVVTGADTENGWVATVQDDVEGSPTTNHLS